MKVTTNQSIIGYGEGVDAIPGTYYLVKSFGNRIRRRNPLDVHRIFEDIRKGGIFQGAQAGMYIAVLSAIEIAPWDLAGKALNVPVYRPLGGKFRDRIRVYYDTVFYAIRNPTPKHYVEAGKKGVEMGFNALKYDVDEAGDPSSLSNEKVFHDVSSEKAAGLCDGFKIDKKGNVFAAGPGGIWIFTKAGKPIGRIKFNGVSASNCALTPDNETLFITANQYLLTVKMR